MKITMYRERIHAWGMMGLFVVGLSGWFVMPARAVPIDYILVGGLATGGFTIDTTSVAPYQSWAIDVAGDGWSNLTDIITIKNSEEGGLNTGIFDLETRASAIGSFYVLSLATNFVEASGITYALNVSTGGVRLVDEVGRVERAASVPEPTPGILLMIGLLILAGARWWTHRQEGLLRG